MESPPVARLICFLEQDLGVPPAAIRLAQRYTNETLTALPMVLWQFGLITLDQLDRTFDWLATL